MGTLACWCREGVNCEHMQALVTNMFQRHWEWQEDRWTDIQPGMCRYNTAFMASLDVKKAFDVAKPSVVSHILTLTGVHGHLAAALLAASAKEVWRLLCCGDASPNMCFKERRKSGEPKGWELSFGGQHDTSIRCVA